MKTFLLIATVAVATLAAAPANSKGAKMASADNNSSAQQASDIGPASKTAPATDEKKICKLLPTTGTRMSKNACLTAKEWKQVEADVEGDGGY